MRPGEAGKGASAGSSGAPAANTSLDEDSQRELRKLQQTDREVRAHEAAHLAAAGGLANGGASFSTTRGPDGRFYATGGEVSISIAEGRNPQETLQNARQIRAAALAPADPSGQDYRVAAQAGRMEAEALRELAVQSAAAEEKGAAAGSDALGAAYGSRQQAGRFVDTEA